jgi:hypothetical protein
MKEGSLFCFVVMRSWDASDRVLGDFGKLSTKRGAWALVPWCLDLQCKSS